MKTIPLEEALRLATKGPLVPSSDPRRYPAVIAESGTWVAKTDCSINSNNWTQADPIAEANAALLAHFYNHGPELMRVLEACLRDVNSKESVHPRSRHTISLATQQAIREVLAKASTVQMP